MITLSDFYHVMTAVVPLYVAMILAYGSVKWWKIFTPDQCSGINRFVALFAVPLLSFHFIVSMSDCCQVAPPLGVHEKCPVSLSLLARHGGDRFFLDTLQTVYASFQEQADTAAKPNSSNKAVTLETSAEMAKEKGNQAFKDKQWQRAIGFYSDAIKLNSNNATYYSNRAAAYLEIGSILQAEADCTQAIDLDKKNVKAYLRRGTSREMLGYYKEAMEDFRYALVLEPNNKRAAQSLDRLKKLFQ